MVGGVGGVEEPVDPEVDWCLMVMKLVLVVYDTRREGRMR
jgi:hypothetical protein